METTHQRWFPVVVLFAVAYLLVGIAFGELAGSVATNHMRDFWRLAAWVVSCVGFTAHIWYGLARLRNLPRTTALHASFAAALGAFGLAVAANIHAQFVPSSNKTLLALALVLWPLLTAVPAFLVAYAIAFVLARLRRSGKPTSLNL